MESLSRNIFFLNNLFGGYHLTNKNLDIAHEIDAPSGAFFLTRKELMEKLGGFDEDYFMYGEDIDLAFQIKKLGYRIIYYPKYSVSHLKYQSGLGKTGESTQVDTKKHFYNSMKIFYEKNYRKMYPKIIGSIVNKFIDLKSKL